ncbi:MAG: HAD family phosphatase [Candidatus Poseidonia sp.]|nr:HAD family phosphatase [Poseidonia sp.]
MDNVVDRTLPQVVVFDCDGVLVDAVSSWKTLHDAYGTDNSVNLNRFIRGEISDMEFMRSDIAMWKEVSNPIHRDEVFRAYSGAKLMKGARELVNALKEAGVFVAIVSAGVDVFVSSIASLLKVDDWIANGFVFDDDGYLTDEGVCRLHATGKGQIIENLLAMHGFDASGCVSVGDSEMDLSMQVEGSRFIGFNPSRESSWEAFTAAEVPIIVEKDLFLLYPYLGLNPSGEGN